MLSIEKIATNLKHVDDGIWASNNQSNISYPSHGNQLCRQVEDSSFWFKHRNNCIVTTLHQYPPSEPLLDIGGGNGFVSAAIKNAGLTSILLEPGIQGVLNAKARGLTPIIHSTLQDSSFKPGCIPAAGLFDVLEHIDNDVAFLKDIEKILEPGGLIYLTVPAYNFLFSHEDDEAGHYRRYTIRTLSKCLRAAGFEVEFSSYIFFILPIPIFLFRTLPSKLSRVKEKNLVQTKSEHTAPSNIFGKLLNALFACEQWLIMKKIPIPFGGSCLLVARKPR